MQGLLFRSDDAEVVECLLRANDELNDALQRWHALSTYGDVQGEWLQTGSPSQSTDTNPFNRQASMGSMQSLFPREVDVEEIQTLKRLLTVAEEDRRKAQEQITSQESQHKSELAEMKKVALTKMKGLLAEVKELQEATQISFTTSPNSTVGFPLNI